MRHIMHTVEHAALVQPPPTSLPMTEPAPPMQKSAHPLCRNLHTPYAEICTLTIEENQGREL